MVIQFIISNYHFISRLFSLFLAGNIGHRLSNAKGVYQQMNANILLLEYRGYGLSEGTASEAGLYKDAQAGLNYLHNRQDIDTQRIMVFGRSLGNQSGRKFAPYFNKPQIFILQITCRRSCCHTFSFEIMQCWKD